MSTIEIRDSKATTARLRGWWLMAARSAWVAIVGLAIVMYAAALPNAFNMLNTLCQAEPCVFPGPLRPEVADALQAHYGLSLGFLAWFFTISASAYMVFYVPVALLMFWRKSNDRMILLVSLMLITYGSRASPFVEVLTRSQPIWIWPSRLVAWIGLGLFTILFHVFPDGRFVPRWTRWLTIFWLAAWGYLITTSGNIFTNPLSYVLGLAVTAIGTIAQVYRYRRVSSATQRQQTKWVVLSFVALFLLNIIGLTPYFAAGAPNFTEAASSPGFVLYAMFQVVTASIGLSSIAIGLAFSIFRYRLWDVDFIINRSLVYGALTTCLVLILALALFIISRLFSNFTGGPLLAVAVSAVVFGASFQPLRRRLQRLVDQRFYGIHIQYDIPVPQSSPAVPTQRNIGTYTSLNLIGRGGMGEVYSATNSSGKMVAVKILPVELAQDPNFRKRFDREARLASTLKHENIVQILDFGEENGVPYLVMEYISGHTLAEYIRQHSRLALSDVMPLIEGIARALDYAHTQGLVHRDIKPANVMLDGTRPALMDFGIARMVGRGSRYTETGGVLGSLDYIAPEQIQAASDVNQRADIYAFGVMPYQMLTGELPFKKESVGALLLAHLMEPPPDPCKLVPDLSEEVRDAIWRALAKKTPRSLCDCKRVTRSPQVVRQARD